MSTVAAVALRAQKPRSGSLASDAVSPTTGWFVCVCCFLALLEDIFVMAFVVLSFLFFFHVLFLFFFFQRPGCKRRQKTFGESAGTRSTTTSLRGTRLPTKSRKLAIFPCSSLSVSKTVPSRLSFASRQRTPTSQR